MKTDLAELFAGLKGGSGDWASRQRVRAAFETYQSAVRASPASKIKARVSTSDDLWRLTAIGAILSDVTLLSGTKIGPGIAVRIDNDDPDVLEYTEESIAVAGLIFCDSELLNRWADDADGF